VNPETHTVSPDCCMLKNVLGQYKSLDVNNLTWI